MSQCVISDGGEHFGEEKKRFGDIFRYYGKDSTEEGFVCRNHQNQFATWKRMCPSCNSVRSNRKVYTPTEERKMLLGLAVDETRQICGKCYNKALKMRYQLKDEVQEEMSEINLLAKICFERASSIDYDIPKESTKTQSEPQEDSSDYQPPKKQSKRDKERVVQVLQLLPWMPSENPSDKTFFKYPQFNISSILPFYVDSPRLSKTFSQWLTDDSNLSILCTSDAPGTGKTTGILSFALNANCCILRLEAGSGLMTELIDILDLVVKRLHPKEDTTSNILLTVRWVTQQMIIHVVTSLLGSLSSEKFLNFPSASTLPSLWPLFFDDTKSLRSIESFDLGLTASRAQSSFLPLAEKLTSLLSELSLDKLVIFFDNMEKWQLPSGLMEIIPPSSFAEYYLLGLTQTAHTFSHSRIRFAISSQSSELEHSLHTSRARFTGLYLGDFPADAVEILLLQFLNVQHLDSEALKDVFHQLSGCQRQTEYFLKELQRLVDDKSSVKDVTMATIRSALSATHRQWTKDLQSASPSLLWTEYLLVLMFHECLGGTKDGNSVLFPIESLTTEWISQLRESGWIRFQAMGQQHLRLWLPHPFFAQWILHQTQLFASSESNALSKEFTCGFASFRRKDYRFQRAVAIELLHSVSPLWKHILNLLERNNVRGYTNPGLQLPLLAFGNDVELVSFSDKFRLGVLVSSENDSIATLSCHLCGPQEKCQLFIEARNSSSQNYLIEELHRFFENCEQRSNSTLEVYIFLSLKSLSPPQPQDVSPLSRRKRSREFDDSSDIQQKWNEVQLFMANRNEKKLFLLLDGIEDIDTLIDISQMSNPSKKITLAELLENLSIVTGERTPLPTSWENLKSLVNDLQDRGQVEDDVAARLRQFIRAKHPSLMSAYASILHSPPEKQELHFLREAKEILQFFK